MAVRRLDVGEREPETEARSLWMPKEVTVERFRGVVSMHIPLHSPVNLLVGANGAGKTSVLQSIEWLLTGDVQIAGSRVTQEYYTPTNGGSPYVRMVFEDSAGIATPLESVLTRTLSPHRFGLNAHECAGKDAPPVIEMRMGWTRDLLQGLLWVDRFVGLAAKEQQERILDLLGGGGGAVISLRSSARDPLQTSIAQEIEAAMRGSGPDMISAAIERVDERRKAADRRRAEAETSGQHSTGALEEALAQFAEAGYEANSLDEIEGLLDEAEEAIRAQLAEAEPDAEARLRLEATLAAKREALEVALADAERVRAGLPEDVSAQVAEAEAAVEAARAARDEAAQELEQALAAARTAHDAEFAAAAQAAADARAGREDALRRMESIERNLMARDRQLNAAVAALEARASELHRRQTAIRNLSAAEKCPMCRQVMPAEALAAALEEIRSGLSAIDTERTALYARIGHVQAAMHDFERHKRVVLAAARAAVDAAQARLDEVRGQQITCPEEQARYEAATADLAAADEALVALRHQQGIRQTGLDALASLEARREGLADEIADAQASLDELPADIADTVATLREALAGIGTQREALVRARGWAEAISAAAATAEEAQAESLACKRLKTAWQELLGTSLGASDDIRPVLDDVTALLRPITGWIADWTADGPMVLGPGWRRPFAQLSDGEKLIAGAAWHAALARRVGLGIGLIDHAAEVDEARWPRLLEQLVELADAAGITYVAARHYLGDWVVDGVDVTILNDGIVAG